MLKKKDTVEKEWLLLIAKTTWFQGATNLPFENPSVWNGSPLLTQLWLFLQGNTLDF